jgi:hypothetical protein
VVAFELLTGVRPFARESTTAEAMAHVREPIPTASSLNPDLPVEVDDVFEQGLAKDPGRRFASSVDLVAALREALDAAAGRTAVMPAAAPRTAVTRTAPEVMRARRRRFPLVLVLLAGLLLAGVLAAVLLAGGDDQMASPGTTPAAEKTTSQTTTATPPPPPPPAVPAKSPAELNDEGFRLLQQGNYEEALPLLEQAVAGLAGTGQLVEAYASYNLAFTRFALGRCDGVRDLLERSKQVQGKRKEIEELKKDAEHECKRH